MRRIFSASKRTFQALLGGYRPRIPFRPFRFADHTGFRCGTYYEYPVYDLEKQQELRLRERPLIAMDATVIDDRYVGLGPSEAAVDYLLELKQRCKYYNGNYVLLWHNQHFLDPREKEIYRTVIG